MTVLTDQACLSPVPSNQLLSQLRLLDPGRSAAGPHGVFIPHPFYVALKPASLQHSPGFTLAFISSVSS